MSADNQDDEDPPDLFRKAVGKIPPLKQDKVHRHRTRRKPVPEQTLRDQLEVMNSLLSDDYEPADVETGEELLYTRPGLQHSVIRKLRRGQYAIEAQLDLHGATVVQAREAVNTFLNAAQAHGK